MTWRRLVLASTLILLGVAGCARTQSPAPPAPTGLEGQRIMLLPVRAVDPEALNHELAFWLAHRSPVTEWILPDELQRAADQAAGSRVRLSALPRQITDPGRPSLPDRTYSELRRLGAVVDATLVLMPVAVREVPDSAGQVMELTAALVDVRGGRVLWLVTARGEPTDGSAGAAVTAVAAALARALFPP